MSQREKVLSVTASDCKWETFRAGGSGGQNQNSRSTGVRCIHVPSGAVGVGRDDRKQINNKRNAFKRMADTKEFKTWVRMTSLHIRPIEEIVDEQMKDENLLVEYV